MINKVQHLAGKISNQRHMVAVRNGMAAIMPLVLISAVFTLIASVPIPPFTKWLKTVGLLDLLNQAANATFGIIGVGMAFTVAYQLAKADQGDSMAAGLLSLAAFILVTPVEPNARTPFQSFGASGLVVAIIVALISTEGLRLLTKHELPVKLPANVPPNVARAFAAIVPGLIIILLWLAVVGGLKQFGATDVHALVTATIAKPLALLVKTLPGIIIVIGLQCFFWLFGMHGAQVTGPVIEPLLLANSDANRLAHQAGEALPNIITYEFVYNFVFTGGAGCLFALALLLYFRSHSQQNRDLGRLSMAPLSFQVAEPVLFGLPIILNAKMAIPFVLAPVTTALITYFGMAWGWVAKPIGIVLPWATPPVLAGYLATGGRISGAVISLITIAVNVLIYYPFFKADDNQKLQAEQAAAESEAKAQGIDQ